MDTSWERRQEGECDTAERGGGRERGESVEGERGWGEGERGKEEGERWSWRERLERDRGIEGERERGR